MFPDIAGIGEKLYRVGNGALGWKLGDHSSFFQGAAELP